MKTYAQSALLPSDFTYKKDIKIAGANKAQLYQRALQFFVVSHFDKPIPLITHFSIQREAKIVKQAITYQNEGEGKIFGEGLFTAKIHRDRVWEVIHFDIKIHVENNLYKYTFDNFRLHEIYKNNSTDFKDFDSEWLNKKYGEVIANGIDEVKHRLKVAMLGEL